MLNIKSTFKVQEIKYSVIVVFILFGLVSLFYIDVLSKELISFVELNISSDGNIKESGKIFIKSMLVYSLWFYIITIFAFLFTSKTYNKLYFINIYNDKILLKYFVLLLLYFSYILMVERYPYLFIEDGFYEYVTALFFFISVVLFYNSLKYLQDFKLLYYLFIILIFISLFVSLEEISYGQRLFDWSTPEYLEKINFQNETNFHNLVVSGGEQSYIYLSYILIFYYFISIVINIRLSDYLIKILFFSYSDILILCMISISALVDAEATEFFISILVLEMSFRNFIILKKEDYSCIKKK